MEWSRQQADALIRVHRWLDAGTPQVFYLAGFAGTGKTTLAMHFAEYVKGLVLFAAFTGKAASVLRKKGCPEARTLHSILYDVSDSDRSRLRELQERLDRLQSPDWQPPDPEAITPERAERDRREEIARITVLLKLEKKRAKGPRFSLNPMSPLRDAKLLVLDECSMIDERLGKDVLSFGKPVLVIGDPAQLPPVYGAGYFTSADPDFLLTEIHRQAQGNPIIRAATATREHRPIPYGEWGSIRHLPRRDVDAKSFVANAVREGSQILCGKNATRRAINRDVRRALGYNQSFPQVGETLVVLRNDSELGVLNGVVCRAATDAVPDPDDDCHMIDLDYEGELLELTPLDRVPFMIYDNPKLEEDWSPGQNRHLLQADWGYALTVHKSQGSEWDDVTLWDDGFGHGRGGRDLRWQWLYTAITRAAKSLTIISGDRK